MNGPSVGAPGWTVATHFYGNLHWIRKSVNARRAAAARRRICRVTPPVKEVLFVHYLLGSTWGELTLRSMTSHDWLGLLGRPGEGLRGAIVNAGGGKEGDGPTLPPRSALPLGKRSAGWSREDADHFRRESQLFALDSCRAPVRLDSIWTNQICSRQ